MGSKASFKTILKITKDIGFMLIFYSYLSMNDSIFLKTVSVLILSISFIGLFFFRKEKASSSYQVDNSEILEKVYSLTSILTSIIALYTLIYIFFMS